MTMDLTTTYLGLDAQAPARRLGVAAVKDLDGVRRLEDAGAAAVVLHSLFEEQISSRAASSTTTTEAAPRASPRR